MNLVDDVEVLKKTEIFDKEGVLKRKGQMAQLQSYVKQLEGQVKKLSGDLQTAERETVNSRKRVETEKFKTQLHEISNDTKFKNKVQVDNLKRIVDNEQELSVQN